MLQMRFLERSMNVTLIITLLTACAVNMVCLLIHL